MHQVAERAQVFVLLLGSTPGLLKILNPRARESRVRHAKFDQNQNPDILALGNLRTRRIGWSRPSEFDSLVGTSPSIPYRGK